ncbi:hypothetical protein DRQ36_04625 [bacterium]|nr:MAG: hypothetical protein DRQ36_04625 [bacterium]
MKAKTTFLFPILFFIIPGILLSQTPTLTVADPCTVHIGDLSNIMLYGSGFLPGITSDFGAGIDVLGTMRLTGSQARANIDVLPTAPIGLHDVIITNPGGEADTLFDSFWVLPEGDPPIVTLIWPHCGDTIACNDSAIFIQVEDASGIDETSIQLRVDGVIYGTTDPELTLSGDTLLIWRPSGVFPEGLIDMSLLDLADIFGNHILFPPFDCSFLMDTTGPVFDDIFPPDGGTTRDFSPIIFTSVFDELTAVDTLTMFFVIDGDTFHWGEAPVRWLHDTLFFYASYAGLSYDLHDTIEVCVGGADIVGPCGPNWTVYCWEFSIEIPPPLDLTLTVESINPANFPMISAYCLVNDEADRMIEGLDERNFRVWMNSDEQYPLIVNSLGGGGAADIVWCIDTTGSMWGMIDEVSDRCVEFAESLVVSGIDYRLGLVTFSDIVNFPYGYDLTGSALEFQTWVSALGASGGGDGPEVAFDAIYDALEFIHWRPGARKVICLVSDAPYHYLGDGTGFSDVVYSDVYSAVMSHDAICFVIIDTGYTDPSRPYNGVYWGPGSITEETGGGFYSYTPSTSFDTILVNIVENIRGGYYVRWSTSHPVASCDFRHVEIEAFIDEFGLEDDDESDYWAPCSPLSAIVEPHPDTVSTHPYPISNRRYQRIIMDLSEIEMEDSVDESSIQLVVEDRMFTTSDPELVYDSPLLIFTPTTPWEHHLIVDVVLARVMDTQGNLPYAGPIRWCWGADTMPPVASNLYPAPGITTPEPYEIISFKITDDFSGVNEQSILFTYCNREGRASYPPDVRFMSLSSPGVSWDGATVTFDPTLAEPPIVNSYYDTICVAIIRAMDMPDYEDFNLGPNSMETVEWCYVVLDDDTLCPEFTFLGPYSVPAGTGFNIYMEIIDDLSGVYDPADPGDPQGVILIYDTDGDLDDGYIGEVPLSRTTGDSFKTDFNLPGLDDEDDFVFAVYACDDDTDGGNPEDRACCWSDTFSIHIIRGPLTEIIYPKPLEVSTNEDQEIVMLITDSVQGVDETSIIFGVNGIDHTVDGTILDFTDDILTFYPPPAEYFTDGMWVACSLKQALDNAGDPADPVNWKFFVDLTPPVPGAQTPSPGAIVLDLEADITVPLRDVHRQVEPASLELILGDTLFFGWGDAGIYYDDIDEAFAFLPEEQGIVWSNNDSICVDLIASDILPDYGAPNVMDTLHWCFFPSVTSCNYYPNPFTPNGDGVNESVYFTYPYQASGKAIIRVFDIRNEKVFESEPGATSWDGSVIDGGIGAPGLYMFLIDHEGEIVCSGTILLVR